MCLPPHHLVREVPVVALVSQVNIMSNTIEHIDYPLIEGQSNPSFFFYLALVIIAATLLSVGLWVSWKTLLDPAGLQY